MTITQIDLPVSNVANAIQFYRDILELNLLVETPGAAIFDAGPVRLMLASKQVNRGSCALYFHVENIEAARDRLRSRGVSFEREPHLVGLMPDHELWMAFFHDPDGNALALMCRKPLQQPPLPVLP